MSSYEYYKLVQNMAENDCFEFTYDFLDDLLDYYEYNRTFTTGQKRAVRNIWDSVWRKGKVYGTTPWAEYPKCTRRRTRR
jgi:hypothetical protein